MLVKRVSAVVRSGLTIGGAAECGREGGIVKVPAGGTVPFFTGVGAGIGAFAGTLFGQAWQKKELIYHSMWRLRLNISV